MIMVDANWCLSEKSRKTEEFLLSRLHDSHIPATLIFNKVKTHSCKQEICLTDLFCFRWILSTMIRNC